MSFELRPKCPFLRITANNVFIRNMDKISPIIMEWIIVEVNLILAVALAGIPLVIDMSGRVATNGNVVD